MAGHEELATGGYVEVHALLVGQSGHGATEERLGGIGHAVSKGSNGLPAPGPEVGLVIDEKGRAKPVGQFH